MGTFRRKERDASQPDFRLDDERVPTHNLFSDYPTDDVPLALLRLSGPPVPETASASLTATRAPVVGAICGACFTIQLGSEFRLWIEVEQVSDGVIENHALIHTGDGTPAARCSSAKSYGIARHVKRSAIAPRPVAPGAHRRCSTSQIELSMSDEIIGEEGGADDHPSMPLADVQLTAELIAGVGWMDLNP